MYSFKEREREKDPSEKLVVCLSISRGSTLFRIIIHTPWLLQMSQFQEEEEEEEKNI